MPESEARQTANQLALPTNASWDELGIPNDVRPTTERAISMVGNISDDMLILLSLVSEETHRKVELFRLTIHDGNPIPADEQCAWNARLAEFQKWKAAGS